MAGSTTFISIPGTAVPSKRESPGTNCKVVGIEDLDRLGDTRAFEHLAVDRVAHQTGAASGERCSDRGLGHPERREHAAGPEPERLGGGDERLDRLGVDRLGAAQRQGERREVEPFSSLEGAGRQHPREVRAGGRRAAIVGDPLHPVAGMRHEVLWGGLHQLDPLGHRQRQEPDQSHVVVERQPRHHRLLGHELGRLAAGVDVGRQHPVGDHHALRFARRSTRVLQDHQPFRVVLGHLQPVTGGHVRGTWQHRTDRFDRGIAGGRLVERGELVVDQHQLGVTVADPGPGRVDELVQRSHPHRQWQHHRCDTGQPTAAHDRHQLAAGRTEHGDVVARQQALGLEGGPNGTRLVVDLAPRDVHRSIGRNRMSHEVDARARVGSVFEAFDRRLRRSGRTHGSRRYLLMKTPGRCTCTSLATAQTLRQVHIALGGDPLGVADPAGELAMDTLDRHLRAA